MSKNLVIGTKAYEGVSTVNFNTADGNIAVFKDVEEMTSGSFNIPTELTLSGTNNTDADMTMNEFFLENKVIVKGNELIILKFEGDTAPTTQTKTLRTLCVWLRSSSCIMTFPTGATSAVPPSSITNETSSGSISSAYISRNGTTGELVFNKSITYAVPAGCSVYYARYPLSHTTGLMLE